MSPLRCKKIGALAVISAGCLLPGWAQSTPILTQAGTATIPAGVKLIKVDIQSGSGGGGGRDTSSTGGGGTGGTSMRVRALINTNGGESVAAVIGQGGLPGLSSGSGGLYDQLGGDGGLGDGAGGKGGTALKQSGSGGGGGGATSVKIGSGFVIRAGGAGGGGGGSWNTTAGLATGVADTSLNDTPDCSTPGTGQIGQVSNTGTDGGGGGGGGGGFVTGFGAGGMSGADNARAATGGNSGKSCYTAGSSGLSLNAVASSAEIGTILGGAGAAATATANSGKPGSVLVSTVPTVSISCTPATIKDSDMQTSTCTVTLSEPADAKLAVNLSVAGDVHRYSGCTGPLSIAQNATSESCTITATANTVPRDGNADVTVTVAPASTFGDYVVDPLPSRSGSKVTVENDDFTVIAITPPTPVTTAQVPVISGSVQTPAAGDQVLITLSDGTNSYGPFGPVSVGPNGEYSLQTQLLPAGNYTVTAAIAGVPEVPVATGNLTVSPLPTSVTVSVPPSVGSNDNAPLSGHVENPNGATEVVLSVTDDKGKVNGPYKATIDPATGNYSVAADKLPAGTYTVTASVNGVISAPAIFQVSEALVAAPVPTLDQWALALLSTALAGVAAMFLRRRTWLH